MFLKCSKCAYGHDSKHDPGRICPKCLVVLEAKCPSCGRAFDADGEFCPSCGAKAGFLTESVRMDDFASMGTDPVHPGQVGPQQAIARSQHSTAMPPPPPRQLGQSYKVVPFGAAQPGCGGAAESWTPKSIERYQNMLNEAAREGWRYVDLSPIPFKSGCWPFQTEGMLYLVTFVKDV